MGRGGVAHGLDDGWVGLWGWRGVDARWRSSSGEHEEIGTGEGGFGVSGVRGALRASTTRDSWTRRAPGAMSSIGKRSLRLLSSMNP